MKILNPKKIVVKFFKLNLTLLINLITLFLKLKKERCIFLRENRIGHQAGNADVEISKAIKLSQKNINSTFVFFEKEENIANKYLRSLLVKEINKKFKIIVLNELFSYSFLYFLINKIQQYSLFNNTIYLSYTDVGERIKKQSLYKSNNLRKLCENLGIESNKYVCIYSRDQNYLKNKFPSYDWDYHKYRNSNIDNLRLLSEYLVDNYGLSIIRVGSNPTKKLNWAKKTKPKIIDYSFSEYLSARNDIDLICGCRLYISNGGGLEGVAMASRRNMIKINQIPIGDEHNYSFGPWAPKIHFIKNSNRYLSLLEICKLNLERKFSYKDFIRKNIDLKENDNEEILNIFKDYIKYKNNLFNKDERLLIKKYKEMRVFISEKWNILNNQENFISPSFLIKYPNLLR